MKHKKILLPLLLIIAAALGFLVFSEERKAGNEEISGAGETLSAELPAKFISYNGNEVGLRRMTSTLLIIGTDNYEDIEFSDIVPFYNRNMGDFLLLLVFDDNEKTITPIQISRETMCDVPWISANHKVGGTNFEQITFAHTYGSGKEDSCENVCSTVSSLLFNAPVDHYMAFTMSAVPEVNDAVGGVKITLNEDLTELDPSFTAGRTITLKGDAALRFVRTRDHYKLEANNERMSRHRQYIEAFTAQAKTAAKENSSLALNVFNRLTPYMTTDVSGDLFLSIADKLEDYKYNPILYPTGELKFGEKWAEFYPDPDSLFSIVKQALCE